MEKFQAHPRSVKYKTQCFKTPLGDSDALKCENPVLELLGPGSVPTKEKPDAGAHHAVPGCHLQQLPKFKTE